MSVTRRALAGVTATHWARSPKGTPGTACLACRSRMAAWWW